MAAPIRLFLVISMLVSPLLAVAAECSATSGTQRVPLLELYTSEGCDSCPPADRWVSSLSARGLTPKQVVTLAFHVDYWNHLGWPDPYARPEYSARQQVASHRNGGRFVYTPQLLLDGKDYRRGSLRDDLDARLAAANREQPSASIRLSVADGVDGSITAGGEALVQQRAHRPAALAYLALYENRLASQVFAGENRGRRLEHDFVVRELAGPFRFDTSGAVRLAHSFRLDRTWKKSDLHVAAFVQDENSGEALQSLVLAVCRN
ncbi:MAG TPA: DUF1223 domain-containing protein [Burkholderiales bacterium]|nr:DUF1223 domain-containing protein [Burkholderiales bacterium]